MSAKKTKQEREMTLFHVTSEDVRNPDIRRRGHRESNKLNDLDPKEWLISTKSVWYQNIDDLNELKIEHLDLIVEALRATHGDQRTEELLGQIYDSVQMSRPPSRDRLKAEHPATFAETDIERLILFFTKTEERVLDPFLGSGSTLIACRNTGRSGVGVELVPKWAEIARRRVEARSKQLSFMESRDCELKIHKGDSRSVLPKMPDGSFSFVVTSPPYWSVLNKPADHKVKRERVDKGLETRYSDDKSDLANVTSYERFLKALSQIFKQCFRLLERGRYIAVIASDFRDKSRFHLYHADIANILTTLGFELAGITVLVQDSKALYPYGMPYAFVSNIHHQYVVIARKPAQKDSKSRKAQSST